MTAGAKASGLRHTRSPGGLHLSANIRIRRRGRPGGGEEEGIASEIDDLLAPGERVDG